MNSRTCKTSRRALTIVELLVVVMIIAITASLVIPAMSSDMDFQAQTAAKTMVSDLEYAQNMAIQMQTPIYVEFDTSTNRYALLSSRSPWTALQHPASRNEFVVKPHLVSGMSGVVIESVSFDGHKTIAFDELGSPYSVTMTGTMAPLTLGEVVIRAGTRFYRRLRIDDSSGAITVN